MVKEGLVLDGLVDKVKLGQGQEHDTTAGG